LRLYSVCSVTDPIADLLNLAEIEPAYAAARSAVDAAMRHPALRRTGGPVAAEVGLRDAVASAALEGHEHELDLVRAGAVADPVLQGSLRVSQALDGLAPQWSKTPRQVLAKLHVLAARDVVGSDDLGRPTAEASASGRIDLLCSLVTGGTAAPAMVLAAVVHAELLALSAFAGPNGVVARGAARLTLIGGGLDPRGLLAVDVGHAERGPEYVGAAAAFATGTQDGVRSWLKHYAAAIEVAAAQLTLVGDEQAKL
jgi:hypothetical protein